MGCFGGEKSGIRPRFGFTRWKRTQSVTIRRIPRRMDGKWGENKLCRSARALKGGRVGERARLAYSAPAITGRERDRSCVHK